VTFLEQPLAPGAEAHSTRPIGRLPILADESCVTLGDVAGVQEWFDGFNIKLVKCGGITPALKMARLGRELGLLTMVGCMLESSALIAAGAAVAQATDYADLDGAWLLGDDPFNGWAFSEGTLIAPDSSGLGAMPNEQLFG
jgi:L-alanine-DL-glutamate epimerase-like enolase superfamily enzyme